MSVAESSVRPHVVHTETATVSFSGGVTHASDTDSSSSAEPSPSQLGRPDTQEAPTESEIHQPNGPSSSRPELVPEGHTARSHMTLPLTGTAIESRTSPMSPERFNPFNKKDEDLDSVDPFPQLQQNNQTKGESDSEDSWLNDAAQEAPHSPDATALGLTEDYFSPPQGQMLSSVEDLEAAISDCKQRVMTAPPDSDARKELVHQLIQLRLQLTEAQEGGSSPDDGIKTTVGHRFLLKATDRSQRYCEQCNGLIWGVIQGWYRCSNCGFCCHEKCLSCVTRTCASVRVDQGEDYITDICPERTLATQNYRCAECRTDISFHSTHGEPRLCDYSGAWYCDRCHWNDHITTPARILHNWDMETRKVCRGSKQYLKLMRSKPVLRVVDINPMLFNFVEELNDVKKLREEILVMKQYFLSCRGALQSKLLLQLRERQHFVDSSDMYSLQDLLDVAADVLLPELAKIHASFAQHIKTDCPLCQAKGNVCELCDEKEVLFPFDNIAIVCSACSTVLHRHCFMSRNQRCPKCVAMATVQTQT